MVSNTLTSLVNQLHPGIERSFCLRVYSTEEGVYLDRLRAIGFEDMANVLDAGCGYGQWTLTLGQLNGRVTGVDISLQRVSVAKRMATQRQSSNITFHIGLIENLPFADNVFDGVFSYSALYMSDWRVSLRELHRVLKPGGLFYFSTNGLGWYLYNLIEERHHSESAIHRQMAIDALSNSLTYYAEGRHLHGKSIVMPSNLVLNELKENGYDSLQIGGDGKVSIRGHLHGTSFYSEQKYGFENVYEVLCKKKR